MKQNEQDRVILVYDKKYHKIFNPHQYYHLFNKALDNREKVLQQLQQLGVSIQQKRELPLNELIMQSADFISRSYSLKYLGMKAGQIGVLSKRVALKKKEVAHSIDSLPKLQNNYVVNNFFYPKPMRVGKKASLSAKQDSITSENIESELKHSLQKYENIENKRIESRFKRIKLRGVWNTIKGERAKSRLKSSPYDPIYNEKKPLVSYSRILENLKESQNLREKASKLLPWARLTKTDHQ